MAVNVVIKNQRPGDKDLSLPDLLLPGVRYGVLDEAFRLDENKLGDYIVVFDAQNICRGFELSCQGDEAELRLPLPNGWRDIHFFYNYVKKLCQMLQTMVFWRDDEELLLSRLESCIQQDIKTSERVLLQMLSDVAGGKYEHLNICGVMNPIALDENILRQLGGDSKRLDKFMHGLQAQDLYYAKASVYQKKDGALFGIYTLTADVVTVLPFEAKLPGLPGYDNKLQVEDWYAGLVFDDKFAGVVPYQALLDNISTARIYDAEHFIVSQNRRQLQKLLLRARVEP